MGVAIMDLDSIPLYDGEITAEIVVPQNHSISSEQHVRSRRRSPRKTHDRVLVCFSAETEFGRSEHVECPLLDMSPLGMAVEFDHAIKACTTAHISYSTISHQPVRVSGTVRRCTQRDDGRYIVGIQLDRRLSTEECRPAVNRRASQAAPGVRIRKLPELTSA
jgi:hypothetical protein